MVSLIGFKWITFHQRVSRAILEKDLKDTAG